ncbi:general transcription factor 3C polypeptide 1 [Entomortierella parvispora]|uniref:General transcription factor 3C polypeptide 1 n=1 Tax=Entomortierella parvispora TaxID=205924 RepID=A0A9P3LYH2_9FUNG|nr:general transcription factor 3C polypeptide 1 [Entomortierella parvispora]
MDDLVQFVQNEVALDGQPGCSWDRFWYFVEEHQRKQKETLSAASSSDASSTGRSEASAVSQSDEKFRYFLWNNLVEEEGIILYVITDATEAQKWKDSDITKATPVPFSKLEALTLEKASYHDVVANYRDTIRIAASLDQQQLAALGYSGVAIGMPDASFHILQTITASREVGVTQVVLAKQFSIDPKSMFHFLKVLLQMKLIVKIPVTTDGLYTLLCLHVKFADKNMGYQAMTTVTTVTQPLISSSDGRRFEGLLKQDSKRVSYYSGLIKQKLTDILGHAKNQVMTLEDLILALDLVNMNTVQNRWFNRQIELLCKLKYIQRVQVPGFHRCVKLVKPYGVSMAGDEKEKSKLNLKAVIAEDTPQSGICVHKSVEHQIYTLICDSKSTGILAKEIRYHMDNMNLRLMARILDGLCKSSADVPQPHCRRVLEFKGREKRYRYFSATSFKDSLDEDEKQYIETTNKKSASHQKKSGSNPALADTQAVRVAASSNRHVDLTTAATPGPSSPVAATEAPTTPTQEGSRRPVPRAKKGKGAAVLPEEGAPNPDRYISVALMQRRKVILSMVERDKMMEIQGPLVAQYQAEKRRLYPEESDTTVIDRRTLYRTINLLESEKKVRIIKVDNLPMVGGGMQSKTFCLDYELDPESEEVRRFVKDSTNRNFLFGSLSYRPTRKQEELEIEVETLDELQQRLGGRALAGPEIPFARLGAVNNKNKKRDRSPQGGGGDFDGSQYCYEFGWIRAKMMRALIFHRFIVDRQEAKDSRLYPHGNLPDVMATAPVFETLPLRIFMLIIGVVEEASAEAKAYMEDPKNAAIPLGATPDFLSRIRRPTKYFKKRLREALEILDAVGLVSPLEEMHGVQDSSLKLDYRPCNNHLVLNTHYKVHRLVQAPLHPITPDLLDADLSHRKEYDLFQRNQCKAFWLDLQSTSANLTTERALNKVSMERPWSEIRRNFLLSLCNKRLWTDPIRISAEQKNMLMMYVDKKRQFAPVGNRAKLDRIAAQTGLPSESVAQFYKSLQGAWTAQQNRKHALGTVTRLSQVKRVQPSVKEVAKSTMATKKTPGPSAAVQDKTLETAEVRVKIEPNAVWTGLDTPGDQPAPSTSTAAVERSVVDAPEDLSQLGDDELDGSQGGETATVKLNDDKLSLGPIKQRRRTRRNWTPEHENELLITVAVVRSMSEIYNSRFSWAAVARVFEDRTPEHCRHRCDKLLREPDNAALVDSYKQQFGHQYLNIALKVPIDPNLNNFDPRQVLKIFRPTVNVSGEVLNEITPLPRNAAKVLTTYSVRQEERYSSLYAEDKVYPLMSQPRLIRLLSSLPSTLRLSTNHELDALPSDLKPPMMMSTTWRQQGKIEEVLARTGAPTGAIAVRDEVLARQHVIFTIMKAVFSTSHSPQTADLTRVLLSKFDANLITDTVQLAKGTWKLLINLKGSTYRIPGQKLGRSERLTASMVGLVSSQWTSEASRIDSIYSRLVERMFQDDVSRAEMMVIMSHVGQNWLKLSVAPLSEAEKVTFEPIGVDGLIKYDVCMKNTRDTSAKTSPKSLEAPLAPAGDIKGLKRAGEDLLKSEFEMDDVLSQSEKSKRSKSGDKGKDKEPAETIDLWEQARQDASTAFERHLKSISDDSRRHLFQAIFNNIEATGSVGLNLVDLKAALVKQAVDCADKDIRECVRILEYSKPPIIFNVGMTLDRYVKFGEHESRTINYQEALAFVITGTEDSESSIESRAPSNYVSPRTWRRLDGVFDEIAFEKSLHAVVTHIAERPGITKGILNRDLYMVFMSVELDELLEELVNRKAVWMEYCILPPPAGLFTKRRMVEPCDKDTIHDRKITNLFVVPDYYRYLDMALVRTKVKGPIRKADKSDDPNEVIEVEDDEEEEEDEEPEPEDEGEPEEDEEDDDV